ncbi:MAG: tetratricopeptide repeat protein [Atribacterota bacterium]
MPLRVVDYGGNENRDIQALIQEGHRCFFDGQLDRAKALFQRVLQGSPSHPEALHGLGVIALKEGRYKEAIRYLQQAVAENPHFAEAWNNLGFALYKKGRYHEAQEALEKALQLTPREPSVRENVKVLARLTGKKVKAVSPFLSLCMIVRDEVENLQKHLARMKDYFDDVVVVDTGSQDATKTITSSLGARVFSLPWENDFSKARNESLKHARGEWILVLDADEFMDEEGVLKLKEVAHKTDAMGFQLPIYNYNRRQEVGVVNFALRFFRRHPKIRFAGRIHETVEDSIVTLGGTIGRVNIPIHHFGYTDPDALTRKTVERNFPIIEELYRTEPENVQAVLYYAKTKLVTFRDHQEAKRALLRLVGNPRWRGRPGYIEGLLYLGHVFADEKRFSIAERIYEKVRQYDPYLPDALFALGNLYFIQGLYSKALEFLEGILTLEAGKAKTNLVRFSFTDEVLYERLTRSAIECGQIEKAINYGEKLRNLLPDDPNVLHNLALAYFQGGQYLHAETLWREVLQKDSLHAEARSLLFYLYTLQGRSQEAQSVLQEVTTLV